MREPQLSHEVWSFVSQVERGRAFAILSDIMPIGARAKGMLNHARQAGHPAAMDFSQLRMPVLLISAEDDRFGTAAAARKIAAVEHGGDWIVRVSCHQFCFGLNVRFRRFKPKSC